MHTLTPSHTEQCVPHPVKGVIISCPEGRPVTGEQSGEGPDRFLFKTETRSVRARRFFA